MLANMYFVFDALYAMLQIVVTLFLIAVWALSFVRATVNLELPLGRRIYWGVIQAVFPLAIPFYLWKYEKSRAMRVFSVCGIVAYLAFWFVPYDYLKLDTTATSAVSDAEIKEWGWKRAQNFVKLWGQTEDGVYGSVRGSFTFLGWSGVVDALKQSKMIDEAKDKNLTFKLESEGEAAVKIERPDWGRPFWVVTYPARLVTTTAEGKTDTALDGVLTLQIHKTLGRIGIAQWLFEQRADNHLSSVPPAP